MFEIALNRNYCHLTKTALEMCKMLDKRLVPDAHPMWQFTEDCSLGKLTNPNDRVIRHGYLRSEVPYKLEKCKVGLSAIYENDYPEVR